MTDNDIRNEWERHFADTLPENELDKAFTKVMSAADKREKAQSEIMRRGIRQKIRKIALTCASAAAMLVFVPWATLKINDKITNNQSVAEAGAKLCEVSTRNGETREVNSGLDNSVIPEVIELLIQTACKFIPKLGTLRIMRTYAGVRPGTPDGDPYIGLVSGVPGFCECCGHGGEGIALSPATGEAIAELLIDGHTKHCDISRFSPDRVEKV